MNMTPTTPKVRCSPQASGFTLTEVAISVGIATICILTLLGLVPFGLDTLRTSANRQAEARMIQTIVADYQMATWIKQDGGGARQVILADKTFFFDQTGTQVTSGEDPNRMYSVQAKVNTTEPKLSGDPRSNPYLRRLNLRFTGDKDYSKALVDNSGKYTERPTWIANVEQTGALAN